MKLNGNISSCQLLQNKFTSDKFDSVTYNTEFYLIRILALFSETTKPYLYP